MRLNLGMGRRILSRLSARSVLLNTVGIQRSPPATRTPRHAPRASASKSLHKRKIKRAAFATLFIFGRGRRIRTLGTRFWRPLLYQLSYAPVLLYINGMTADNDVVGLQGFEPGTYRL